MQFSCKFWGFKGDGRGNKAVFWHIGIVFGRDNLLFLNIIWASRFGKLRLPRVGLSAPSLASLLRSFASGSATIPLANRTYWCESRTFGAPHRPDKVEILFYLCYLCAFVPNRRPDKVEILFYLCYLCAFVPNRRPDKVEILFYLCYLCAFGCNFSCFILHSRAKRAAARGIEAEPPAKLRSSDAGDGADSPTRAKRGTRGAKRLAQIFAFLALRFI
jgi:hypothetical protein